MKTNLDLVILEDSELPSIITLFFSYFVQIQTHNKHWYTCGTCFFIHPKLISIFLTHQQCTSWGADAFCLGGRGWSRSPSGPVAEQTWASASWNKLRSSWLALVPSLQYKQDRFCEATRNKKQITSMRCQVFWNSLPALAWEGLCYNTLTPPRILV